MQHISAKSDPVPGVTCPFLSQHEASAGQQVPDHLRAVLAPASWILRKWVEYRVHFPGAICMQVGSTLHKTDFGAQGAFRIIFENQLGLTPVIPIYADGQRGEVIHVEVIAHKFPTLDHSVAFLQTTLADLFSRGSALPFVTSASTQRGIRESHQTPNDLFAFHFFRHRGQELIRGVQAILGRPHQVLADETGMVRIHEVKRIDSESLIRLLQGTSRAETGPVRTTGTALERLRPERVVQRLPFDSHDMPENRPVVTACRRMLTAIEGIERCNMVSNRANQSDRP